MLHFPLGPLQGLSLTPIRSWTPPSKVNLMPHTSSVLPLAAYHHHHSAHRSAPSLPFSATTDLFNNLFAPSQLAMNYGDHDSQYDERSPVDQPRQPQAYGRQSQPVVQPLYAAQSSNGSPPSRANGRPSDESARNGTRPLTLAPILNHPQDSTAPRNSWDESGRAYPDWNPQTSPSYQLQGKSSPDTLLSFSPRY